MIVVEDGKPIERNLERNRITLEELAAAARQNKFDSLEGVRWAVLETNGRISFIPRSSGAQRSLKGPPAVARCPSVPRVMPGSVWRRQFRRCRSP